MTGILAEVHDDDITPGTPATARLNRPGRLNRDLRRPATILDVGRDGRGKVRRLRVRYEDNGVECTFTRRYLGSVFRNYHGTHGPSARDAYRLDVGVREGNVIFGGAA